MELLSDRIKISIITQTDEQLNKEEETNIILVRLIDHEGEGENIEVSNRVQIKSDKILWDVERGNFT